MKKRRTPPLTRIDLAYAAALLAWSRALADHGQTWEQWQARHVTRDEDLAVAA